MKYAILIAAVLFFGDDLITRAERLYDTVTWYGEGIASDLEDLYDDAVYEIFAEKEETPPDTSGYDVSASLGKLIDEQEAKNMATLNRILNQQQESNL